MTINHPWEDNGLDHLDSLVLRFRVFNEKKGRKGSREYDVVKNGDCERTGCVSETTASFALCCLYEALKMNLIGQFNCAIETSF